MYVEIEKGIRITLIKHCQNFCIKVFNFVYRITKTNPQGLVLKLWLLHFVKTRSKQIKTNWKKIKILQLKLYKTWRYCINKWPFNYEMTCVIHNSKLLTFVWPKMLELFLFFYAKTEYFISVPNLTSGFTHVRREGS